MDIANYLNDQGSYPVSAETFDFIQEQIKFVAQLTSSLGKYVIIKDSGGSENGLVIFDDELLPLVGDKDNNDYITIREKVVSITAKGTTYEDARKTRTAEYTPTANGEKSKHVSDFEVVNEEARRQHYVPKGAIMMWSGAVGNIPAGWALCDGANGTPDLRGRFVVGYNPNDTDYNTIGNFGGEKEVTLTDKECALPSHKHLYSKMNISGKIDNGGTLDHRSSDYADGHNYGDGNPYTENTFIEKAEKPHENRPPYYVLAYIMKIV